jgi:hypothetical protein
VVARGAHGRRAIPSTTGPRPRRSSPAKSPSP